MDYLRADRRRAPGQMVKRNLRKGRYSVDIILQMLREKDVFNIDDVELAVLEANGKLTVYKKPQKTAVTAEDLGIAKTKKGLAYPIIVDGSVSEEVLSYLKKDMTWLESQLQAKGLRAKDIFFASVDEDCRLHISHPSSGPIPAIRH